MRKNVRNDKVVRAITIGLATMIAATSMPVTAFANDEAPAAEAPAEAPAPAAAEAPAETPAETQSEAPAETQSETPAETQSEAPAETPAETPEQVAEPTTAEVISQDLTVVGEAVNMVTPPAPEDSDTPATPSIPTVIDEAIAATAAVPGGSDEKVTVNAPVMDDNGNAVVNEDGSFKTKEEETTVGDTLAAAKADVEKADVLVKEVEQHLESEAVKNFNTAAGKVEENVNSANESIKSYNEEDKTATEAANNAIEDASKANNSATLVEALENKKNAEGNLSVAEQDLLDASKAVDAADKAVNAAAEELENVKAARAAAEDEISLANTAMTNASATATAAHERLKAAQAKMDALNTKAEKLTNTQKELNEIKKQYDAFLVQYYTDVLGGNGVVCKADGTLDFEKCAAKITDNQINGKSTSPGNKVMYLGRDLMRKLVEYMVKNEENVDFANSDFKFGDKEDSFNDPTNNVKKKGETLDTIDANKDAYKSAYEGILFESGSAGYDENGKRVGGGRQQVVVDENRGSKNSNGVKDLIHNPDTGFYWVGKGNGDGGRTNRVLVTYKDKDGVEQKKYYNYIFKNSNYEDDISNFITGPIYLGEIKQDENGKWKVNKETDDFCLDDYTKLKDALKVVEEAKKADNEYKAAKAAVDEAEERVKALEKKINELEKVQITDEDITKLENKLSEAQKNLDNTKKKEATLKEKVEEAKKAVDAIDLSRFNPKPSTGGDSTQAPAAGETDVTTPSADAPAAATVIDAGSYTVTIPAALSGVDFSIFGGTAATVTAPAAGGVAGVREDAAGEIGGGAIEEAGEENEEGSEETVNPAEENKIKNIDDVKVPLAAAPPIEEGLRINWWWFLVILLLGETGKKLYDDHMMKVRVREEADRIS